MKKYFFAALVFLSLATTTIYAHALSEYGIRCEDNKDCVECRENIACIKCIHICENAYGSADGSTKHTSTQSSEKICQLIRAKWCNAQCWDPDDTNDPEYVSTKPNCADKSFWSK